MKPFKESQNRFINDLYDNSCHTHVCLQISLDIISSSSFSIKHQVPPPPNTQNQSKPSSLELRHYWTKIVSNTKFANAPASSTAAAIHSGSSPRPAATKWAPTLSPASTITIRMAEEKRRIWTNQRDFADTVTTAGGGREIVGRITILGRDGLVTWSDVWGL